MSSKKDKIYTVKINTSNEGLRLDKFLGETDFIGSRSQALKLITDKKVLLKNKALKASHKLKLGEVLKISVPPTEKQNLSSYDIDIDIVYEDKDILVVNKAAGLVVHPAPGHSSDTLVNALFFRKKLSSGSSQLRPGVVHRLDKDTSGLLILSKNKKAEQNLIEQFKNKSVTRNYWALSLETPRPIEGTVQSYLCRHPISRKKFISIKDYKPGSKKAITHYKVLKQHNNGITLIECQLETGRTHQIRVHLNSLNCPVLGDSFYSKKKPKSKNLQKMIEESSRIALHAYKLKFQHPRLKKNMVFQIDWPKDLKPLLKNLNFIS